MPSESRQWAGDTSSSRRFWAVTRTPTSASTSCDACSRNSDSSSASPVSTMCSCGEDIAERVILQRDGKRGKPYQIRQVRRIVLRNGLSLNPPIHVPKTNPDQGDLRDPPLTGSCSSSQDRTILTNSYRRRSGGIFHHISMSAAPSPGVVRGAVGGGLRGWGWLVSGIFGGVMRVVWWVRWCWRLVGVVSGVCGWGLGGWLWLWGVRGAGLAELGQRPEVSEGG